MPGEHDCRFDVTRWRNVFSGFGTVAVCERGECLHLVFERKENQASTNIVRLHCRRTFYVVRFQALNFISSVDLGWIRNLFILDYHRG